MNEPEPETSYDVVPYRSQAFPQTHPDRLAAIARVFGLTTPDVTRCRVLELGCASGGNLLPMAVNLPESTFVGIDLSRHQVDEGRQTIRALSLDNITIEHASIADVDEQIGTFDYIVCHGVFSWVERSVQDKILAVVREQLAPNGIAYISYNTYPGWHMREMVRHMLRYHASRFDTPAEQIAQARGLLTFLAAASSESGPFGQLLRQEAERLARAEDTYLYHEHLEQTNTPFYFHHFIERAERAGLQYLAEASFNDMMTKGLPPAVAETVERLSPDILHVEQYMDFVRNRQFRQTLLCHRGQRLQRALGPALMRGLLATCDAVPDRAVTLDQGAPVVFTRGGGQRVTTEAPLTKAALACLAEQWPRGVEIDELCVMAAERAASHVSAAAAESPRKALMEDIFQCFLAGLIELRTVQPRCTTTPSATPAANVLAAFQAATSERVVNARHETVTLGKLGREMLRAADGRRDRSAIVEQLVQRAQEGALTVDVDEARVTDPEVMRAAFDSAFDECIARLARAALIVA